MRKYEVKIPEYNSKITFLFGKDYDNIKSSFTGIPTIYIKDTIQQLLKYKHAIVGCCFINKNYPTKAIIWCPTIPTKPTDLGLLIHEIFHAVSFLLTIRGLFIKRTSGREDEPYAYLIGYITKTILQKLKK